MQPHPRGRVLGGDGAQVPGLQVDSCTESQPLLLLRGEPTWGELTILVGPRLAHEDSQPSGSPENDAAWSLQPRWPGPAAQCSARASSSGPPGTRLGGVPLLGWRVVSGSVRVGTGHQEVRQGAPWVDSHCGQHRCWPSGFPTRAAKDGVLVPSPPLPGSSLVGRGRASCPVAAVRGPLPRALSVAA